MSAPSFCYGSSGISCGVNGTRWFSLLYFKQVEHFVIISLMSLDIVGQYMTDLARVRHFSMQRWLLWNFCSISLFILFGMTTRSPAYTNLWITQFVPDWPVLPNQWITVPTMSRPSSSYCLAKLYHGLIFRSSALYFLLSLVGHW